MHLGRESKPGSHSDRGHGRGAIRVGSRFRRHGALYTKTGNIMIYQSDQASSFCKSSFQAEENIFVVVVFNDGEDRGTITAAEPRLLKDNQLSATCSGKIDPANPKQPIWF